MNTALIWVGAATIILAIGFVGWWILRAAREGHESGPTIDVLERELDEAIEVGRRRAEPMPTSEEFESRAARELDRRRRMRNDDS